MALAATACTKDPPERLPLDLAGQRFKLELALTDAQIEKGMMFREAIGDREGMLFVFPDAAHRRFWMKNCRVPIDVIFMDGQGWIVAIRTMTPPDPATDENDLPRYPSGRPAQFAIELQGGMAEKLGLKRDDQIALPLSDLNRWVR